jgi:pSer/pThr/pTyr-binding forkhead associated (FHA) protein
MAKLIVTSADGERTLDLAAGEVVTVGRDPANRLALPSEVKASRRHCRIGAREDGAPGFEVVDLGSTNKTRVNGAITPRRGLSHGDVVEIGQVKIRFEDEAEARQLEEAGKKGICFLEWASKERKGERILLGEPRVTFGRRPSNTVPLDDRMASGHHAEIVRDVNGYTVRDLGSTNGTMVNGEPISESLLAHGARLRIGNSRFVFKDPSMKDIEVELSQFEEDEGWGMMGDIDLTRARGGSGGLILALLLLAAAVGGGWFLLQQDARVTDAPGTALGEVQNGDFEQEDLLWSPATEGSASVRVADRGRNGRGLEVRHEGPPEGGAALVTYSDVFETVGLRPFLFTAALRGSGDARPEYVVLWGSDPTAEELKGGKTPFERMETLARAGEGWTGVRRSRVPPAWARSARLGVYLPPGSRATLDEVDVVLERGGAPTPVSFRVAGGREASVDAAGVLDLFDLTTLLVGGVRPVARRPDGTLLTDFAPTGMTVAPEGGSVTFQGGFEAGGDDVPAEVRFEAYDEGVRAVVSSPGAAEVGVEAALVVEHLGGAMNVLGDFSPQALPAEPGQRLEKVARVLAGDPSPRPGRPATLVNVVPAEGRPEGRLETAASRDPGLVEVRLTVAGDRASVEIVSDFTKQRRRAEGAMAEARALLATAPGRAIGALRQIALEYPFDETVREEALRLSSERADQARAETEALADALRAFQIYGTEDALAAARTRAERARALYLAEGNATGPLETRFAELVDQVAEAERAYAVERVGPEIDRLQRLVGLLEHDPEHRPLAVLYGRSLVERFTPLADHSEDLKRRLEDVRARLEAMTADESVRGAVPPAPPSGGGGG